MLIGGSGRNSVQIGDNLVRFGDVTVFLVKLCTGVFVGALIIICWSVYNRPLSNTHDVRAGQTAIDLASKPAKPFNSVGNNNSLTIKLDAQNKRVLPISVATAPDSTSRALSVGVCGKSCSRANKLIKHLLTLSDREAEGALVYAHRLANALRQNADLRLRLLQIATELTASQRQLLITAFYELQPEHQRVLAMVLYGSSDPLQRLDGIQMMTGVDVLNAKVVTRLSNRLVNESDVHVREALLRALNQPEHLKGNSGVLQALEHVQSVEQHDGIRGQALLAQANLSIDPQPYIYDAISAIRSGQNQYASDGALVLERILVRVSLEKAQLSAENEAAVHQLMDDLMVSESMAFIPSSLRASLDNLYVRFF